MTVTTISEATELQRAVQLARAICAERGGSTRLSTALGVSRLAVVAYLAGANQSPQMAAWISERLPATTADLLTGGRER